MLDGLRRGDEPGIEGNASIEILDDLVGLGDDALDCLAGLAAGRLADQFEYLLEALDMPLRFVAMLEKAFLSVFGLRRASHFRQGFQDLLLGVIDVLQGIEKEILEGFCSCHFILRYGLTGAELGFASIVPENFRGQNVAPDPALAHIVEQSVSTRVRRLQMSF